MGERPWSAVLHEIDLSAHAPMQSQIEISSWMSYHLSRTNVKLLNACDDSNM